MIYNLNKNKVLRILIRFCFHLFILIVDDINRLLIEKRQRYDALAVDNDTMCRLLEETRAESIQIETGSSRLVPLANYLNWSPLN
jgi:hypothetical protein